MSDLIKSDKEFNIRKSVINNVISNNLNINWDSQKTIKAKAFPQITFDDAETHGLKELVNQLIKTNDRDSFLQSSESSKYNHQFFNNLDKLYSCNFIEATISANKKIKSQVDSDTTSFAKQFVKSLRLNNELNEGMTLFVIVNDIIDALEKQLNLANINRAKIFASYNGSFDVYLKYFSHYLATKSSENKLPGGNDFLDLLHLIYLGNGKECKIVTNDSLLKNLDVAISVEDFSDLYKI
ncbi:hypothetical protein [Flavobacterium marginilacus]|uniref:hypothetical protein n=1 Tax=Flavobacterium marginilacus TaxID=3003256 RepID=UPI00248E5AF0|nr:hypothetical protein [Flavobacterium marginilacus]